MSDKLVTVASSVLNPMWIYLLKTRLEAEGILCCVADEHLDFFPGVGGMKLRVRESDAEKALEIIRQAEAELK